MSILFGPDSAEDLISLTIEIVTSEIKGKGDEKLTRCLQNIATDERDKKQHYGRCGGGGSQQQNATRRRSDLFASTIIWFQARKISSCIQYVPAFAVLFLIVSPPPHHHVSHRPIDILTTIHENQTNDISHTTWYHRPRPTDVTLNQKRQRIRSPPLSPFRPSSTPLTTITTITAAAAAATTSNSRTKKKKPRTNQLATPRRIIIQKEKE